MSGTGNRTHGWFVKILLQRADRLARNDMNTEIEAYEYIAYLSNFYAYLNKLHFWGSFKNSPDPKDSRHGICEWKSWGECDRTGK